MPNDECRSGDQSSASVPAATSAMAGHCRNQRRGRGRARTESTSPATTRTSSRLGSRPANRSLTRYAGDATSAPSSQSRAALANEVMRTVERGLDDQQRRRAGEPGDLEPFVPGEEGAEGEERWELDNEVAGDGMELAQVPALVDEEQRRGRGEHAVTRRQAPPRPDRAEHEHDGHGQPERLGLEG